MLQTSPKRDFFPTKQLVHLQQQGIACSNFQRLLDAIGVGHQQIVSNDLILETDCWWKIWMFFWVFVRNWSWKSSFLVFFWSCCSQISGKIMEKLWHDWIFLENLELKIMSQMDTNGWICNRLHLRMDSFNKNFDWGWSWTSECYWSSLAIQEKKSRSGSQFTVPDEKSRPSLGIYGRTWTLGPRAIFCLTPRHGFFFGFTATSLEQSMRNPWRLGPNFETYPH